MNRGELWFRQRPRPVIVKARNRTVLRDPPPEPLQCLHGRQRDFVCGTDDAVHGRILPDELQQPCLTGLRIECSGHSHQTLRIHAGLFHRRLNPAAPLQSDSRILLPYADIPEVPVSSGDHVPCQFPRRAKIIVIHAVHTGKLLPGDDQRNPAPLKRLRMGRRIRRPHQNNSRHMVCLHGLQVLQLRLLIQRTGAENHHIF